MVTLRGVCPLSSVWPWRWLPFGLEGAFSHPLLSLGSLLTSKKVPEPSAQSGVGTSAAGRDC